MTETAKIYCGSKFFRFVEDQLEIVRVYKVDEKKQAVKLKRSSRIMRVPLLTGFRRLILMEQKVLSLIRVRLLITATP